MLDAGVLHKIVGGGGPMIKFKWIMGEKVCQ